MIIMGKSIRQIWAKIKDNCKLHLLQITTAITQRFILLFAGYNETSIRT